MYMEWGRAMQIDIDIAVDTVRHVMLVGLSDLLHEREHILT